MAGTIVGALAPACSCEIAIADAGSCAKCGREIRRPLADLRDAANSEHERTVQAATAFVVHAVRAGEALLLAREQLEGRWEAWLRENFRASVYTAALYMRFARHREHLRGVRTWDEAVALIRQIDGNKAPALRVPAGVKERARELRAAGKTYQKIGEELGIDQTSAHHYINPRAQRDQPAQKAQRERLARDRIDRHLREAVSRTERALTAAESIDDTRAGDLRGALGRLRGLAAASGL